MKKTTDYADDTDELLQMVLQVDAGNILAIARDTDEIAGSQLLRVRKNCCAAKLLFGKMYGLGGAWGTSTNDPLISGAAWRTPEKVTLTVPSSARRILRAVPSAGATDRMTSPIMA